MCACTYNFLLGRHYNGINQLKEKSSNLATFSRDNFKLCIESRRQQLGLQHIDVLRLLLDAGEDAEESLKLQISILGDSHIICLETAVELARREQKTLKKQQRAMLCDTYSVFCPSDKIIALHEFQCKRMQLVSKQALLLRNQRAQLSLLHPDTLQSVASLCSSLNMHHGVRWASQKLARTLGPQHVAVQEMLGTYSASVSVLSRMTKPALVFFALYIAPPLLWYLALLVGPYYKFVVPVMVAAGFALLGCGLFSCYTAGHIRSEFIVAKKMRRVLADPDFIARREVQEALVLLRELDEVVGPLPTFDRLLLFFKRILLLAWRCGDLNLLRLPRHFLVTSKTHIPQQSSRVFPVHSPPNDMSLSQADLEAAHVMQQLVDMGFSSSAAQSAIASVGHKRAIEHVLSGAMN
jgi:hypothetical protein